MPPVDTHKIDSVEKLKLRACDLRPGMYVCELDRPWLDTPFLLQGFEVANDADIEAVMQQCDYVYIDLRRTRTVKAKLGAPPIGPPTRDKNAIFGKGGLQTSAKAHQQTTHLLKNFADEIRFGHTPKFHLAKSAVSECVAGVVANPAAMLLMTRLRQKDEYTSQHAFNVCVYSVILGRLLGLDARQLENLGTCGLLHDTGKLEIPDAILNKPGKLTEEEFETMRGHTTKGRDILMSGRDLFSGAVDVAYAHHENLDGSGYPRGLQGHQLNTNCKIVGVVDRYDALTTHRPYRPGQDHLSAVAILNAQAKDNKIDAKLKSAFVSYLGVYPPGTLVELSSGEAAIVLGAHPEQRLRPQLLVVRDADKNPVERFVDMSEIEFDPQGKPYRIVAVHTPGYLGIDTGQYCELIIQAFDG